MKAGAYKKGPGEGAGIATSLSPRHHLRIATSCQRVAHILVLRAKDCLV